MTLTQSLSACLCLMTCSPAVLIKHLGQALDYCSNLSTAMRHNLKQTCTLIMHQQQRADQSAAAWTLTCSDTPSHLPSYYLFLWIIQTNLHYFQWNSRGNKTYQAISRLTTVGTVYRLKTKDVMTVGSDWTLEIFRNATPPPHAGTFSSAGFIGRIIFL